MVLISLSAASMNAWTIAEETPWASGELRGSEFAGLAWANAEELIASVRIIAN